ncbi:RNA polymerase sigma factor [Amycolatopsis minnesotensis]|uniref:RNA polymerase sigma factor n=2 Tax=Amycolatopsis minnesotensis TaxID=337894 RepID=A0ABN2Q442_9PSEU
MSVPVDGDLERPPLTGGEAGAVLTRLYDASARSLHRYLSRRLDPATADDLVAETFLVAWRTRDKYRPELGTARGWLFGIATNLLRGHRRSELRGLRALAREHAAAEVGEAADAVAVRRAHAASLTGTLAAALARLRQDDRDVLLLVAWGGLNSTEVAEALGIPAATARTRLHRARHAVRPHLPDQHEENDHA